MSVAKEKILKLLQKHKILFKTISHPPVRTSIEANKVRPGFSLHQGAKSLILKVYFKNKLSKFIVVVLAADHKLDKKLLKQKLNAKNFRFATEEEVKKLTGVQPGGIPPFGSIFGLKTYVDKSLLDNKTIVFNAGDRSFSIAMKLEDYLDVEKPAVLG